ncbi:MAG TPA: hypothetical protein VL588_05810 [Bdellovibrionota bacterium]|jgi:hypothetical protein|nr:hypothetical protein [Bdellovibrionota bacterium]
MSVRPLILLLAFVCATTARAQGPLDDGLIHSSKAVHSQIRVHSALVNSDEESDLRGRMIPVMQGFVRYWERQGLRLPDHTIDVYVQPDPSLAKRDAITRLYGDDFFSDLSKLRHLAWTSTEVRPLRNAIKKFSCQYPPFFGEGFLVQAQDRPIVDWRVRSEQYIETVLDETRALPGYVTDNGYFSFGDRLDCDYIILGRSTMPTMQIHPFQDTGVVLHELAHALVYGAWTHAASVTDRMRLPGLHEALADLMAQMYLMDPCHAARENLATGSQYCLRRMDGHDFALSKSLWAEPHHQGDPLRHLVWSVMEAAGQETAARALGQAIVQLAPVAHMQPQLPYGGRDPFLNRIEDYSALQRLVITLAGRFCGLAGNVSVCAHPGVNAFLGADLDQASLSALRTNSPTAMAEPGRDLLIPDGRRIRLAMKWNTNPKRWDALVKPLDGGVSGAGAAAAAGLAGTKVSPWACQPIRENFETRAGVVPGPRLWLDCRSPDEGVNLRWTCDGKATEAPLLKSAGP